MKKVNIKDISIEIDIQELNEKTTTNFLAIDLDGNLLNSEDEIKNKILVFKNEKLDETEFDKNDLKDMVFKIFNKYKPSFLGTKCVLKPLSNWQEIIELNKTSMLYFDHQSDGVEIFEDSLLEEYGWHGSALEISYRQITDFIEETCEGTLLCYENEVQFSGFAVINDIDNVRKEVYDFIVKTAKESLKNGKIDLDDEDASEACEYFNIEV